MGVQFENLLILVLNSCLSYEMNLLRVIMQMMLFFIPINTTVTTTIMISMEMLSLREDSRDLFLLILQNFIITLGINSKVCWESLTECLCLLPDQREVLPGEEVEEEEGL